MEGTMEYIEVSGKTVDEALTNALVKLGTTSDKVEYEVVEKGSSGFLGLFNAKDAIIKARVKEEVKEESILGDLLHNNNDAETENKQPMKKQSFYKEETVKKAAEPVKKNNNDNQTEKAAALPEEEIEKRIKTFLADMFASMEMEVAVEVSFDHVENNVNVNLTGDNMGVLIGKRGQTLDSIQYLTSLVVNKGKEKYVRVKLDTEDYRRRRKDTLESLAKNIAYKVKRSRRSVSLEPMNPYERRIIHSALQNDKFVSTKSEGEEPFRHVVIFLDKEKNVSRYEK